MNKAIFPFLEKKKGHCCHEWPGIPAYKWELTVWSGLCVSKCSSQSPKEWCMSKWGIYWSVLACVPNTRTHCFNVSGLIQSLFSFLDANLVLVIVRHSSGPQYRYLCHLICKSSWHSVSLRWFSPPNQSHFNQITTDWKP